jgi:hypothetical protein
MACNGVADITAIPRTSICFAIDSMTALWRVGIQIAEKCPLHNGDAPPVRSALFVARGRIHYCIQPCATTA